jgi:hypothetical protein
MLRYLLRELFVRGSRVSPALAAFVIASTACQSSLSADAKMSADLDGADAQANAKAAAERSAAEDEPLDHDRPLSKAELDRSQALAASEPVAEGLPLFGARHDVTVKSTDGAVSCRCVGVLLGPPTMSQVTWQGAAPRTKPDTQLLVALAPESECPGAPKGTQGGSYWGYRVNGKDVVVLLEGWSPQPKAKKKPVPPRTIAAIIPKPPPGGQVYVAPLNKKLPFGGPVDGKGTRCAIGNPGPARNTPLAPEDLGSSVESNLLDVAE